MLGVPAPDLEQRARSALHELWTQGRVSAVDQFFAQDVARRAARHVASVRKAFPDFSPAISSVSVSENTAVLRWTARGTHLGAFAGLEPTGRSVAVQCVTIYTFRGSTIVERTSLWEMLELLDQLTGTT
jgi:predicted ester cyclase